MTNFYKIFRVFFSSSFWNSDSTSSLLDLKMHYLLMEFVHLFAVYSVLSWNQSYSGTPQILFIVPMEAQSDLPLVLFAQELRIFPDFVGTDLLEGSKCCSVIDLDTDASMPFFRQIPFCNWYSQTRLRLNRTPLDTAHARWKSFWHFSVGTFI